MSVTGQKSLMLRDLRPTIPRRGREIEFDGGMLRPSGTASLPVMSATVWAGSCALGAELWPRIKTHHVPDSGSRPLTCPGSSGFSW